MRRTRMADEPGSLDFVNCEFPVPDPSLQNVLFRTRSLYGFLERYTITRDGRLIRRAPEGPPFYEGPFLVTDVELPVHGDLDLWGGSDEHASEKRFVARFRDGRAQWIKKSSEARPRMLSELLRRACKDLPGDYRPWGELDRDDANAPGGWYPDCSVGCRHYLVLEDVGEESISLDWGVCINPKSHRYGLLTYEHQGCPEYEDE